MSLLLSRSCATALAVALSASSLSLACEPLTAAARAIGVVKQHAEAEPTTPRSPTPYDDGSCRITAAPQSLETCAEGACPIVAAAALHCRRPGPETITWGSGDNDTLSIAPGPDGSAVLAHLSLAKDDGSSLDGRQDLFTVGFWGPSGRDEAPVPASLVVSDATGDVVLVGERGSNASDEPHVVVARRQGSEWQTEPFHEHGTVSGATFGLDGRLRILSHTWDTENDYPAIYTRQADGHWGLETLGSDQGDHLQLSVDDAEHWHVLAEFTTETVEGGGPRAACPATGSTWCAAAYPAGRTDGQYVRTIVHEDAPSEDDETKYNFIDDPVTELRVDAGTTWSVPNRNGGRTEIRLDPPELGLPPTDCTEACQPTCTRRRVTLNDTEFVRTFDGGLWLVALWTRYDRDYTGAMVEEASSSCGVVSYAPACERKPSIDRSMTILEVRRIPDDGSPLPAPWRLELGNHVDKMYRPHLTARGSDILLALNGVGDADPNAYKTQLLYLDIDTTRLGR